MSVSRRSFFSAVAGAIAGAVASRVVAKAPAVKEIAVPTMAGKAPSIVEFARQYDVLTKIEARKLAANVKVPACLLEDSPIDVRSQIAEMIGREMADKVDRGCWEWTKSYPMYTVDVPEWGTKVTVKSLKAAMDSCPKSCRQELVCSAAQMRDLVAASTPKQTVIDELWGHDKASAWGEQRFMGFPVKVVPGHFDGFWLGNPPQVTKINTIYNADGISMGVSLSTNWPVKNSA